jgi:hypothetical protein
MRKAEKETGRPLRRAIFKSRFFKPALDEIYATRDVQIYSHLPNHVYKDKVCALMCHICKISKNECGLICQTYKWERQADSTRVRAKMCADSCCPAPLIFDPCAICEGEKEAEQDTGVSFTGQDDHKGADIAGAPYFLDRAVLGQLEATKVTRTGGMATAGTRDDPHLLYVTRDGAGVSNAKTGVRVESFPGSTENLNQSSNDECNWLFYTEEKRAESCDVLEKRLRGLHPDLARLYRDGELRPGGVRSGVFIKIVLVADRPFLRHVLGIASHNQYCFGPPFCDCTRVRG